LAQLASLERELPLLRHVSLGRLRSWHPKRTDRLALSKNRLLNEIEGDYRLRSADYFFITDPDEESPYLDAAAIESCWARNDWSVVTANQIGPYYDIWTLRHPQWCPGDCWAEVDELVRRGVARKDAEHQAVFSRMVRVPVDYPWIEVESAFGGSAIYTREALIGRRYWGSREDGSELSDHISIHEQIRRLGGKIFINPKFTNRGFCEHTKWCEGRADVEDIDGYLTGLSERAMAVSGRKETPGNGG
jgi:hypothetical protein